MEEYKILIQSLKRLYNANPKKVTLEKLNDILNNGKITQEEFNYITVEE